MPDARCTRDLVCNVHKKGAHTSIQGSGEHPTFPAQGSGWAQKVYYNQCGAGVVFKFVSQVDTIWRREEIFMHVKPCGELQLLVAPSPKAGRPVFGGGYDGRNGVRMHK